MKLKSAIPSIAAALLAAAPIANAQNATTDPVGFVTVNITAGTGTAKRLTLFSAPLLDANPSIVGQTVGQISAVGNSTLSNSAAGWQAGQLSTAASPNLIQITSGAAAGRMFLISTQVANTSDTLTIDAEDIAQVGSLSSAGVVVGDSYKLFSCDTVASLFGTPASNGIVSGANATVADTIVIVSNGVSNTYFYSSSLNRWTRVAFGNPDASNTPVRPYYGVQFGRLGATPLSLTTTGAVPIVTRQTSVKNSGLTLLSQYWPTDSTLASLGLQSLPNWTSAPSSSNADTVTLISNGVSDSYFYDGTNWRRIAFGNPVANTTLIPVGSTIYVNQKGTQSGYSTLTQTVPYSL